MSLLLDALKKAAADKEKMAEVTAETDIKLELPEVKDETIISTEADDFSEVSRSENIASVKDEEIELELPEILDFKDMEVEDEAPEELEGTEEPKEHSASVEIVSADEVKNPLNEITEPSVDVSQQRVHEEETAEAGQIKQHSQNEAVLASYNPEDARKILDVSQKKYHNAKRTFQYALYMISVLIFVVVSYLYYTAETLDNSQRPAFKPAISSGQKLPLLLSPQAENNKKTFVVAPTEKQQQKNSIAKIEPARPKASAVKESKPDTKKITITKQKKQNPISLLLHKAYQHYQVAEYKNADNLYQKVLSRDQRQRDALLGRAAIAVMHQQPTIASNYYQKILHYYPKDSIAKSALVDLMKKEVTVANETELNVLLRENPDDAHVHFSLGLLYARQNRVNESQQAFFDAFSLQKKADYAFNLAVMLDRLGHSKSALSYYQQASSLSDQSIIHFNEKTVIDRIEQLRADNE